MQYRKRNDRQINIKENQESYMSKNSSIKLVKFGWRKGSDNSMIESNIKNKQFNIKGSLLKNGSNISSLNF